MTNSTSCRLCLSEDDGNHLNIFSEDGIERKLGDIISEHFRMDMDIADQMPNFVCVQCWSITDAFHQLYLSARLIQGKFLNPSIKVEIDDNHIFSTDNSEDLPVHIDTLKSEMNPDEINTEMCVIDQMSPKHDFDDDDNVEDDDRFDDSLHDALDNSPNDDEVSMDALEEKGTQADVFVREYVDFVSSNKIN